jgi:phospho-N-acetylmuramoyl-pentapeptide-transferase
MGGALILIAIGITTLLWGDLGNRYVWVVLIVTLGFGGIGWYDDWQKVVTATRSGLASRWKYFWQSVIGLVVALYLAMTATRAGAAGTDRSLLQDRFLSARRFGFVVLSYLVVVGTSNAVNLTDGLDGLAIMPTVMIAGALAIFAYVAGNAVYAKYLLLPYIPGAGELAIFLGAMAGPASAFSGSTPIRPKSSWATSARWRSVQRSARWPSSCARRSCWRSWAAFSSPKPCRSRRRCCYYKFTGGRRIFRMAPLHHHFELGGWKETQVVVRFWIITIMLVLVGLSTLKLR